jgi:hypothetical protein
MAGLDCPEVFQNPELALERFRRANLQRDVFVVTSSISESRRLGNVIVESGTL